MLPPVNLSTIEHEKKQLKLDKLSDMFEKKLNNNNNILPSTTVDSGSGSDTSSSSSSTSLEVEVATSSNISPKPAVRGQRTHRKYTPRPTKPTVLVTESWSTPRGLNVSRVLSSTLSWTSSFGESTVPVGGGGLTSSPSEGSGGGVSSYVPSKSNSKPFMQTYKINEKKRLPNQFASLRLNYGAAPGGKPHIEDNIDQLRFETNLESHF